MKFHNDYYNYFFLIPFDCECASYRVSDKEFVPVNLNFIHALTSMDFAVFKIDFDRKCAPYQVSDKESVPPHFNIKRALTRMDFAVFYCHV
jgi:hypothetical protein